MREQKKQALHLAPERASFRLGEDKDMTAGEDLIYDFITRELSESVKYDLPRNSFLESIDSLTRKAQGGYA